VLLLGVPAQQALTPRFFGATVAAGLMVGGVNFWLCRTVVGDRVGLLGARMRMVGEVIRRAAATRDWSGCDAERCRVPVDSDDELGESARAFNQLVDAVERLRKVEAELEVTRSQARTDELTGLGNRRHFYAAAEAELRAAYERPLALLLLDLDGFKEINDTLGHLTGDELLCMLARRLEQALPDAIALARLGGDEFVALVPAAEAAHAADALLSALDEPVALSGALKRVRASVGVALAPDHGADRSTLLRHADVAMYRAKAAGGGIGVHAGARPIAAAV
jgi:diguanylate cyclase (GGDEF)-like protein